MSSVPKPSPRVFLTDRQRAVRRLVGLNPDVLWSTGWTDQDGDDVDVVFVVEDEPQDQADDGHAGGCAVCRVFGITLPGQDHQ